VKPLIRAFVYTSTLLGLAASQASAGLTIDLGDVNLAPGGTGTMNITISSSSLVTLSSFGLELAITPIGTPTSVLQFGASASQPNPYLSTNYVFYGQSFNQQFATPFWSVPGMNPMLTAIGGDTQYSMGNFGYVSIGTTPELLATVQFNSPAGASLGDQFQISLVNDPNFTYFDDLNGNPLNGGAYSMSGGVVTIAPSAVPEPSSVVITLTGLGGLLGVRYARRIRKTSRDAAPTP
jgi:hypothetical protein